MNDSIRLKKGDRVSKSPMWKYKVAIGTVKTVTKDGYCVIKWDNINGDWYFTESQSKEIKVLEEDNKDE